MKNKLRIAKIFLTIALSFIMIGVTSLSAQQPSPDSLRLRLSDLENRLFKIETVQTHVITSLGTANEQNKTLLTGFGAVLAGLFVILSIVTVIQIRREGAKETNQNQREKERDIVENAGVKQVSGILDVVNRTLTSRLDAEREAREDANTSRKELDKVRGEVKNLFQFFKKFQSNIQNQRKGVEDYAVRLAQVPRHEFRLNLDDLNSFARQFDTFKSQFEALDDSQQEFSAEALYIRGIASHYANNPQDAKHYLDRVTKLEHPKPGDFEIAYKRRLADTYYYLGLIASNFGKTQEAIDFFKQANNLDPEGTDFLTKIVIAESYVMNGTNTFDKAKEILAEINKGLLRHKQNTKGNLEGIYLRLASRSSLIEANMAISHKSADQWLESQETLEKVCKDDPLYYFATATLAQIYTIQNRVEEARKLFLTSYENIERSGDLRIITEARSKILLCMVASLCCQHGSKDKKRSDEHLDKAASLLGSLPKIDSQECTVFSTFSKQNEKSGIIHSHIDFIRKGKVLLNEGS